MTYRLVRVPAAVSGTPDGYYVAEDHTSSDGEGPYDYSTVVARGSSQTAALSLVRRLNQYDLDHPS